MRKRNKKQNLRTRIQEVKREKGSRRRTTVR